MTSTPVASDAGTNKALLCASWYEPPHEAMMTLPSAWAAPAASVMETAATRVAPRRAGLNFFGVYRAGFISTPLAFDWVCELHGPAPSVAASQVMIMLKAGRASGTRRPPPAGTRVGRDTAAGSAFRWHRSRCGP